MLHIKIILYYNVIRYHVGSQLKKEGDNLFNQNKSMTMTFNYLFSLQIRQTIIKNGLKFNKDNYHR